MITKTKTIWKFPIPDGFSLSIEMPAGAEILDIQVQHGAPVIWALVDTSAPRVLRRFEIVGTGWDLYEWDLDETSATDHVGTYQMAGGDLVWHVFEVRL